MSYADLLKNLVQNQKVVIVDHSVACEPFCCQVASKLFKDSELVSLSANSRLYSCFSLCMMGVAVGGVWIPK